MTDLPHAAPPASDGKGPSVPPEAAHGRGASDYDAERDSIESYNDAIRAIGEAVRAGAPLPACFVPREASQ